MGIKFNDDYRVFAYADSYISKGLAGVNIRIASRTDRNKNINIPVYLTNGQRLKVKPKMISEGKIKGNNDLNVYLDNLTNTILNFITTSKNFNKKLIEKVVYGDGFLDQHKQKRTRSLEIPQYTTTSKPALLETRNIAPKKYGLKTQSNNIDSIDDKGFHITKSEQVVIDPLSLEDFPNNFDKELFDQYYQKYIRTGKGTFNDPKYENDPQMREIDNAWVMGDLKKFITGKFYKTEVTGSTTITKQTIEQYEKKHGKLRYTESGKPLLPKAITDRLIRMQEATDITNMSTEEIYRNALWDRKNIFEMFGSTYYDETVNDTYTKIVVRLMEYREHVKPSEDIKDFNANWVNGFFNWLQKTGWYAINTKNFDPLKYDAKIFFQKKERNKYEIKSLNKMKGIVKALTVGVKGEKTVSFYKKGWLPMIDLSDVKNDKNEKKGTRIDHNLSKKEFDKLFKHKFIRDKLPEYQTIFNTVNKSKNVLITMDDLSVARDIFVLQTMWGGLRGFKEYSTAKIMDHGKQHIVSFYQNKVENTVINPLNAYTTSILSSYKFKKPELTKETESIDLKEQFYRSLLRTIAHILAFDREVLIDKKKHEFEQIKNLFGPYFARKTFGQIMFDEYGLREQEIALFTGHVDGTETELGVSYINKHSIDTKLKFFKKIKL